MNKLKHVLAALVLSAGGLVVSVGMVAGGAVYMLAKMPEPKLTEATATQCTTDIDCEFWADRMQHGEW